MRLLLFKARDLITGRRPSRHKRNLAPRSVSRLEDHRVCAWEPTCNNFIWGQRIVHQPLVGHHALMTSCGLTRHDERTPSVSVRSRQSWFDLANILHADCISHGNMWINNTTRPADFITPFTHGLHQYREDMSTSTDASSMATCFGGSEHCLHRSFAQPSRSKKSDRNQKYVGDSSPEMYAPEHLIINVKDAEKWEGLIENAGSVFIGPWTPESVGDYASGTNHVLSTYGYARMYGGVSLDSFLKFMTVQSLTEEGLRNLGPYVATMAEIEGLDAHKRAGSVKA
ncbi:hypothetical protein F2Q68_00040166 [Brassica cretica]|uniref:histidinol dehydrogenase n=1 Tax=Brassica cretica TaxID=69181 RepID=A0A8S9MJY0_BRACR|nr:hypothetical protein F2Q68_00040166 [Brassica cretica]